MRYLHGVPLELVVVGLAGVDAVAGAGAAAAAAHVPLQPLLPELVIDVLPIDDPFRERQPTKLPSCSLP